MQHELQLDGKLPTELAESYSLWLGTNSLAKWNLWTSNVGAPNELRRSPKGSVRHARALETRVCCLPPARISQGLAGRKKAPL